MLFTSVLTKSSSRSFINTGAFIRGNGLLATNMPKVNLMSSDEDSDILWQPRVERSWQRKMKAHYVNETLFVHGLYSPSHFSHWLYNGMTPLYR